MLADARAGQDDRAVPEPGAVADGHGFVGPHLHADRQVDVFVTVVLVGDVDVVAGPDVVADLDPFVADDADALAEHAAVTDRDHGISDQSRLCGHAGADAGERADRRAFTDRNAAFAVDHGRRERDETSVAEPVEPLRASMPRAERAVTHHTFPRSLHDLAGESAQFVPHHAGTLYAG